MVKRRLLGTTPAWVLATVLALPSGAARAQRPPLDEDEEEGPPDGGTDAGPRAFTTGLEGRGGRRPRPGEPVEMSLEDGDLMDLVRMMTRITGRRFIVTGNVREVRATVASSAPVTAGEAWRAFLAILHQNGLTVVRRGRHWVIGDSDGVPTAPTAVVEGDEGLPSDERFVTWIHRVAHLPVADVAQLLEGLRTPAGRVITHAPTSTLILVETGANLRRMRRILRAVDVPGGDAHVWVEPLHFADADTVASQIRETFDATTGDGGETPGAPRRRQRARPTNGETSDAPTSVGAATAPQLHRVIPEPRTNALIVVATEAGYRRVLALVRELDREGGAEATVHVHRLQHGDAENVAATLQGLLGEATEAAEGAPRVRGLRDRVRVEAHADLNALVVTSTASDYRTVRRLIEALDAPPRQVFLEMTVMELSVDRSDELGVNLMSGIADLLGSGAVGLVGAGGPQADLSDLLAGLAFGVSGEVVTDPRLPGGSMPSFGVLLHALASSERADILSTPHVLALDNREATINIGQSVPTQGSNVPSLPGFIPGATSTDAQDTAAAATAMSAFAGGGGRRDVGTIVSVTPHVNDDGEIRLEIRAEDSRQSGVSEGNLNAATFNQSIAETELVAHDGQTVVIGGLMRDATEAIRTGVPLLSELPILGALFGQTEHRTIKRNLLFFVTPYVIRGPRDLRAIFERRLRERRELLDRVAAFDDEWEPPVDYARTRGLVGEILTTLDRIDEETARANAPAPPAPTHEPRPPLELTPGDAAARNAPGAPGSGPADAPASGGP
ncbi:MAG TPA: type II secretion system secretin GspD [Sandaracinaceae bacterium LLY-WYZ-13_1]|nr:type II secretion system secretin GspD [Sandaracinaceae bacterium LLY-WYZ-13_1]